MKQRAKRKEIGDKSRKSRLEKLQSHAQGNIRSEALLLSVSGMSVNTRRKPGYIR